MQAVIPPVDPQSSPQAAATVKELKKNLGDVPNFLLTMAHSPALVKAYLSFSGGLRDGCLGVAVSEQIALAVAGANRCDYCASAHTAMARRTGVSREEAALNLRGRASEGRVQALLDFAVEIVERRGHVPPEHLQRLLGEGFTYEELMEVIGHVAINIFNNYFNHIAGTVNDFAPVPAS